MLTYISSVKSKIEQENRKRIANDPRSTSAKLQKLVEYSNPSIAVLNAILRHNNVSAKTVDDIGRIALYAKEYELALAAATNRMLSQRTRKEMYEFMIQNPSLFAETTKYDANFQTPGKLRTHRELILEALQRSTPQLLRGSQNSADYVIQIRA
ncbi:MAG: hypothetical protein ABR981_00845 [Candidatus Micrarchaeaceae archaeon]